jgi:integrase
MFSWAHRPDIHKVSPEWVNPVTHELVGSRPRKDPLRDEKLSLDQRVVIVRSMDLWQLCHLSVSIVLPLRPDEATGLLISDVDFHGSYLQFGTRLGGSDFNKGRQSFKLPFPEELTQLLKTAIGGRAEGPLLRRRTAFGTTPARTLDSITELENLFHDKLAQEPRNRVVTAQDRKGVFRRLLGELGGVSTDQLAKEFKRLLGIHGWQRGASVYTLRSAVTTAMSRTPGMPHLELRYLTGHATSDILNAYVALDPKRAMGLYFDSIRPLLKAIQQRATEIGLM